MAEEYVNALKDSLEKKLGVLEEIYRISSLQKDLLDADELDYETFDRYFEAKDICLEKLNLLDDGFELTYNRVKEELSVNKAKYATIISQMQELIGKITDKSTAIEALEARNKDKVSEKFAKERRQAKEGKRSVNIAMNYYRTMSGNHGDYSTGVDFKK